MYPIPTAARLDRIPAKAGSMVSWGPGSATVSPWIRRASKSGVGVASVGTSAVKSAAWLGERRRKAAQIDNAIAFHIVKAQSYRLEFSVAPPGYYIFCLFNRGSSQAL